MIAGLLLAAFVVSLVLSVLALILGQPLWIAALVYVGAGIAMMLLVAVVVVLRPALRKALPARPGDRDERKTRA